MNEATNNHYYFAYGSNTNLNQMAYRCPNAKLLGAAKIEKFRLEFCGNGTGHGVANVRRKSKKGKKSNVHGILWHITPECERSLDVYEGYPFLYTKISVIARTHDGGVFPAMVYTMTKNYLTSAIPATRYYEGILEGFKQNGISDETVKMAYNETVAKVAANEKVTIFCDGGCGRSVTLKAKAVLKADYYLCNTNASREQCEAALPPKPDGMLRTGFFNAAGSFLGLTDRWPDAEDIVSLARAIALRDYGIQMDLKKIR